MDLSLFIREALRKRLLERKPGILTYGKDQVVPGGRGGGPGQGFGGPRGRGTPGYPLPASRRAQTDAQPSLEESEEGPEDEKRGWEAALEQLKDLAVGSGLVKEFRIGPPFKRGDPMARLKANDRAVYIAQGAPMPWVLYAIAHEVGHCIDLDSPEKLERVRFLNRSSLDRPLTQEEAQELVGAEERAWERGADVLRRAGVEPDARYRGRQQASLATYRSLLSSGNPEPVKEQKSIPHIDDLPPEKFMSFLRKLNECRLEVSEKVDGSAMITFGIDGKRIWTRSKTSPRRTRAREWPATRMYAPLRAAHNALENCAHFLVESWPQGVESMTAEVLFGRVPNSIEYGPDAIIIHGVRASDGTTLGIGEARLAAGQLVRSVGNRLGSWLFEYKRCLDVRELRADLRAEERALSGLQRLLSESPRDKATKEGFKRIQAACKVKLVSRLRETRSAYGPEGGDVEGLVFRDLESGEMYKLVDRDFFLRLNRFLWQFRERIEQGGMKDGKWERGVMSGFRKVVADQIIGDPGAASPQFIKKLVKDHGKDAGQGTPEERADRVLALYVSRKHLMSGDFAIDFQRSLMGAFEDLGKLKREWEEFKKEPHSEEIAGKERRFEPEHVERTDAAFQEAEAALDGIRAGMELAADISHPLTQQVALLKLFLGHRFERLAAALGEGSVAEGGPIDRMTGPTDLSGRAIKPDKPDVIEQAVVDAWSRMLSEAEQRETIGVTIGRFQPFHLGHATVIRKLCERFTTVLVFMAGQRQDSKNPFSHDLRVRMMELSLPDVWSKIKVLPATIQGKGTGYIPGLLANAAEAGETVRQGGAVSVLVGKDRLPAIQKQAQHNQQHSGEPGYYQGQFDVYALEDVANDDDAGRISGTRVRQALVDDDKDAVMSMLDPHLSKGSDFSQIYLELRGELKSAGFLKDAADAVIEAVGAAGMNMGPGPQGGRSGGTSGWSRAILAKDMTGDEIYQQMLRSPSTRMLPLDHHGTPNDHLPGQDSLDQRDSSEQDRNKPTDLGEVVSGMIRRKLLP